MITDICNKEIHLTLDELISFSFPSGSIVKNTDFYEKPKTAIAIAEQIAEECERYMLFHPFTADVDAKGYRFIISLAPDLCEITDGGCNVVNVRASGGRENASESLINKWKIECAISAAISAKATMCENTSARLIYSFDKRISPEEFVCASGIEEAEAILYSTIERAFRLISIHLEKQTDRMPSAKAAPFPFDSKRPGQSDFMHSVLRACKDGRKLLCEAPTGIGKTMSALFPTVKAFGHGMIDKIFYLTPKTTAQYAAKNAIEHIFPDGGIRSIVLEAKDKICLLSEVSQQASLSPVLPESEDRSAREHGKCERCSGAHDYYDRRCDALYELLTSALHLTPSLIRETAIKHSVCPYELSLDASEYCDLVICDYNYLFDCRVYLRRYFDQFIGCSIHNKKYLPKYSVLVDEAHNLPDRVRNMYSHTLKTQVIGKLLEELGQREPEQKAKETAERMMNVLLGYAKLCSENESVNERGELCGWCVESKVDEKLISLAGEFTECYEAIKRIDSIPIPTSVTDFYFNMKDLIKKSDYFSEKFKVLCEKSGGNVVYRIMCLDPSDIIEEKCNMARSSVMFSATVSPSDYYMNSLGMRSDSDYCSIPSPYSKDNFSLTVFDTLSTRYNDRDETLYSLARIINVAISAKRGNYMVFFPSYKYMHQAHSIFSVLHPDVCTLIQRKGMTEEEKSDFVSRFDSNNKETLVGFCVLGGVYAEGIDLVGDRLIGAIVVGVGMPRLSNERNMLSEYYSDEEMQGELFSYVYPGMTRVMQAVGRVIRTENDKGIAILLDDRFATPVYKSLFPEHWRHAKFVSDPKALNRILHSFWIKEE